MPKIAIGTDIINDVEKGIEKEWITANGLGSYASSTILGCNTRRYHGLLVASTPEIDERSVLLSKMEETIRIGHKFFFLSTNQYKENYIHPRGFMHLRKYEQVPFPRFIYTIGDITLSKEIFMPRHSNTTIIRYRIFSSGGRKFSFIIHPLLAFRNFHALQREDRNFATETEYKDYTLQLKPYPNQPRLKMKAENMKYKDLKNWYKSFQYKKEKERGFDYNEDLFNPGYFYIDDVSDFSVDFVASCEANPPENTALEYKRARQRVEEIFEKGGEPREDSDFKSLLLAADMHIIKRPRGKEGKFTSVLAGYHWFGDWGRDTFISLAGLALATGRADEAEEILTTFAGECQKGLIPNRFGDLGSEPAYNTVDASLWYINAVYQYLQATENLKFIKKEIYPTCREIVENYAKGTDFGIKMGSDGLISAGSEGTALTWMDAVVDGTPITPRRGKAVEINALWYNALSIMADLARRLKDSEGEKYYSQSAQKVKDSFNKHFWNTRGEYLYDVIGEGGKKDSSFRPNQIYALSLPFPVLEEKYHKILLENISRRLYTPVGLRSLEQDNPDYKSACTGTPVQRDGAYHMGTVWGYMLGVFIEAFLKVNKFSPQSLEEAETMIELWMGDLTDQGLNTLSEIYDGDEPFTARACISQAWSVAEALRIKKILHEEIMKQNSK